MIEPSLDALLCQIFKLRGKTKQLSQILLRLNIIYDLLIFFIIRVNYFSVYYKIKQVME